MPNLSTALLKRRSISLRAFTARSISRPFRTVSRKSADIWGSSGPGRRPREVRRYSCVGLGSFVRSKLKSELVDYNMDDCRAAAMVANALMRVSAGGEPGLNTVDVSSPDAGFQHAFGNFFGALSGFTKINDAACWDYRRDKIYVRSNPRLRRAAKIARRKRNRLLRANTTVDPHADVNAPHVTQSVFLRMEKVADNI